MKNYKGQERHFRTPKDLMSSNTAQISLKKLREAIGEEALKGILEKYKAVPHGKALSFTPTPQQEGVVRDFLAKRIDYYQMRTAFGVKDSSATYSLLGKVLVNMSERKGVEI